MAPARFLVGVALAGGMAGCVGEASTECPSAFRVPSYWVDGYGQAPGLFDRLEGAPLLRPFNATVDGETGLPFDNATLDAAWGPGNYRLSHVSWPSHKIVWFNGLTIFEAGYHLSLAGDGRFRASFVDVNETTLEADFRVFVTNLTDAGRETVEVWVADLRAQMRTSSEKVGLHLDANLTTDALFERLARRHPEAFAEVNRSIGSRDPTFENWTFHFQLAAKPGGEEFGHGHRMNLMVDAGDALRAQYHRVGDEPMTTGEAQAMLNETYERNGWGAAPELDWELDERVECRKRFRYGP